MDLTQLRTFVAIAQEGRLTRAAERLHISQPAASAHIRTLEAELEVQLFARTNRGLELTPAGRRLAGSAERVLGSAVELASLARSLRASSAGRLDLGSNADPVLNRLGPLMIWLRDHHPLIELNLEVRSSLATRQGVRAGELDGGFLLGSGADKGLLELPLTRLEYRIAGPRAWAAQVREADWKELAALPWIVTAPGTSNAEMRDQLFRVRGFEINAAVEVNNDLLVRTLISDGVGIGLVRRDLAEEGERQGTFGLATIGLAATSLLFVSAPARRDDPLLQALGDGIGAIWSLPASA
jgi:DNA-binding transcriptional LysR family regulator